MAEHKKRNHPETRKQTPQRKMVQQLQGYLEESQAEEISTAICDKITSLNKAWATAEPTTQNDIEEYDDDGYTSYDDPDVLSRSIARMQVYAPDEIEEHRASSQSVILPTEAEMMASIHHQQRLKTATPTATSRPTPTASINIPTEDRIIKKLLRFDPRTGKLADGGANCSATSEQHLIHDFTPGSAYTITGCHQVAKQAQGKGYLYLEDNQGNVDRHFVIFDPAVEGTIISPEHHTLTNPRIHRWVQESIPSEHGGQILYYDKDGRLLSAYDTVRHNGLYYMTDMSIIPPTVKANTINVTFQEPIESPTPSRMVASDLFPMDSSDEDFPEVDLEDWQHVMTITPPDVVEDPILCYVCNKAAAKTMTPTEEALLEYEMWHQRFGHVGKDKIKMSAEWLEGLPKMDVDKIIPKDIPHCRACAKGKMQKAHKGPNQDTSQLKPMQKLQMDIGFMRGPSNLTDVVERKAKAKTRVIKSRQGFTCYLLIIDAKTRYIWVFLLKSKHPPIALVDTFLANHGRHNNTIRTIRTDGDGALAQSPKFRVMTLHKHGYIVESTGPDGSSANGMAERPHKTLAIMVRCMLYAALLGVEFWGDALVYAAFLYNLLYHSSIKMSPLFALTGKKGNASMLRTWGLYVTVRKPGDRTTKLDPNHYDGRFMRFGATQKNVVYTDLVTRSRDISPWMNSTTDQMRDRRAHNH